MRTCIAVVLAAAVVAGCGGSNPFRPTEEINRLEDQEAVLLQRQRDVLVPWELPMHDGDPPAPPDFDAWKATVLEKATSSTLSQMEKAESERAAWWRAKLNEHRAGDAHVNHYAYVEAKWELAVVEAKLKLIKAHRVERD